MKIEIKQIYELVGVLAIVVSLIFVTMELRQANTIAQASAEAQLRDISTSAGEVIMESPQLALAMSKLRANAEEPLNPIEYEAVRAFYVSSIATLSVAQQYWERGLLSEYTYGIFINIPNGNMTSYPGSVPIYAELVEAFGITFGINPMWDSLLNTISKFDPLFER